MPFRDFMNELMPIAPIDVGSPNHVALHRRAAAGSEASLDRSARGLALAYANARAYNEDAFHYFLEIERTRSKSPTPRCLLMLISLKKHNGFDRHIDVRAGATLFQILSNCLRETDFIGWYREGRVAGVVLTHGAGQSDEDSTKLVRLRLTRELGKHFSSDPGMRLDIRVCEVSSKTAFPEDSPTPLLNEDLFRDVLSRERKRADRFDQPLALLVVRVERRRKRSATVWPAIVGKLALMKRHTDIFGWLETGKSLGVILLDVSLDPGFPGRFVERVDQELCGTLDAQTLGRVSISLYGHPWPETTGVRAFHPIDDLAMPRRRSEKGIVRYEIAKRVLDIVLSAMLLALLSPLFLAIAALVKFMSPGPVLFRQERVGQTMRPFAMFKFRTMHANADFRMHQQFVSAFIKSGGRVGLTSKSGLFKLVEDPRVTSIGRILRRTSLDELPQLWNVLRGDMSLVGPRPPLAYEVEQYQRWHKRRILEAKPGITGLWQVTGRSRTTFDEMVRLDLRYAGTYSLWTDIKILLVTPRAVISGKGAC